MQRHRKKVKMQKYSVFAGIAVCCIIFIIDYSIEQKNGVVNQLNRVTIIAAYFVVGSGFCYFSCRLLGEIQRLHNYLADRKAR